MNAYLYLSKSHQPANAARSTARPAERTLTQEHWDFMHDVLKSSLPPNDILDLCRYDDSFLFPRPSESDLFCFVRPETATHVSGSRQYGSPCVRHGLPGSTFPTFFSCCNPNDSLTPLFHVPSDGEFVTLWLPCSRWFEAQLAIIMLSPVA